MKSPLLNYTVAAVMLLLLNLSISGCKKSSSGTVATVETNNIISNVTATTATSGGVITNFGSASILANGVCWSATNTTPAITTDSHTIDATTSTVYSSSITGLTASTTYYLRAYATNAAGTAYGSVITFKTTAANGVAVSSTVTTFAGSGTAGLVNGTGTAAQFNNPQAIAYDAASGNLYVADATNNAIRKITSAGVVSTLAGNGQAGLVNGTGTAAEFYSPQGIATDATGNIYVADLGNNSIRKITPAGVVSTLAGTGQVGYRNANGNRALFNNPRGIVVDATGYIYVADKGNNRIRKITPAGVVTTMAGNGASGYLDATDSSAYFSSPVSITIVPSSKNLYVAELGNSAIRRVDPNAVVTTYAGGQYNATLLGIPFGVNYSAADGNMYIADEAGRILQITSGQAQYVLAGTVAAGFTNGAGTSALFNNPVATAVDASGNIYVVDSGNNVIRKITINK